MKRVILYCRVSTDEQAQKGYSLIDQEEVLTYYCLLHGFQIVEIIKEDFSAKNFLRPEWKQLLLSLRIKKGEVDEILVTKWDRYSRDTRASHAMFTTLEKLGVSVQAIEQPLDLSVPENLLVLNTLLTMAEVQNKRHGITVKDCMRRASKDGRFMGTAPMGYVNKRDKNNRAYIEIVEPVAEIVKWIFDTLVCSDITVADLRREAGKKGLKTSKNGVWELLRNPVYMGKIFVRATAKERAYLANGKHEPLISEAVFYEAQKLLSGRKKVQRVKLKVDERLPLRNFLTCPKCEKVLTGSISKNKKGLPYAYYHCDTHCKSRFNANNADKLFVDHLGKLTLSKDDINAHSEQIINIFKTSLNERNGIQAEIKAIGQRIDKAREFLCEEIISKEEYLKLKDGYDKEINQLEHKLYARPANENLIPELLKKVFTVVTNLQERYLMGTIEQKRHIVCSIYPQNISYNGERYRTHNLNQSLIYLIQQINELSHKKNRTKHILNALSCKVNPTGINSNNFIVDLTKIASIKTC